MRWTGLRQVCRSGGDELRAAVARHPMLSASVGYLLIVAAMFREIVFQGRVLFERDVHIFWQTQVESFVRIVTTSAWPLWDPYTSFGQPLLADPGAQVFYPPTWLNLLMRPWVYYKLFVLGHLVFAGVGTFRLARRLGIADFAAFGAGALWILGGPVLSLVSNAPHFSAATWLPWILLAAQRTAQRATWTAAALWGAALAAQIVLGSGDMCALALLGSAVLLAGSVSWRSPRDVVRRAALAALAIAVAVGLAAALLFPTLEVASRSSRRALPETLRTAWSLHPARLAEIVLPLPWQYLALNPDLIAPVFDERDPFLHSVYVGLPTLALLLSALGSARRRVLALLLLTGAAALLLGLGRHVPIYTWLVDLAPLLKGLRYPQKTLVLFSLAVALLGGLGLETWRTSAAERWQWARRVTLPLALVLLGAGVTLWYVSAHAQTIGSSLFGHGRPPAEYERGVAFLMGRLGPACALLAAALLLATLRSRRRWAGLTAALMACVAVTELYRAHRELNSTATPGLFRYRPAVLALLPEQDHSRLYVHDYLRVKGNLQRYFGHVSPFTLASAPRGWSVPACQALALRDALVPPIATAWGYESSYENDFRGLYDRGLAQITLALLQSEETPAHLRLLQIGAVRDVVTLHTRGYESLIPVGSVRGFLSAPIRVWRVPDPLPRTYAVSGVRVLDAAAALSTLVDAAFDPRREVILDAGTPKSPDPHFVGACQIADMRPDRVELDAELSSAGHVVLVDAFDPGWRASVDGRPTPVLRANVAFRAVPVPAGRHRIELVYRPPALFWGLGVSCVVLTLLLGLVGWRLRSPGRRFSAAQTGESRATENRPEGGS